jgi:hypothetical protein
MIHPRLLYQTKQVLGELLVYNNLTRIFECKTLELPWMNNENGKSCIPAGIYPAEKFESPTHGWCFLLKNVPDRKMIEIHVANYFRQLLGCIAVGDSFSDMDQDGFLDVRNSGDTLKHLLKIMPDRFDIEITGRY